MIYILHKCCNCGETFPVLYVGHCIELEEAILQAHDIYAPEFHICDLDEKLGAYPTGICEVVGGYEE